jgi:hypothetical protein
MLAFERLHSDHCYRIRYEDLYADPSSVIMDVAKFAGLERTQDLAVRGSGYAVTVEDLPAVGLGRDVPIGQVPEYVLTRLERLLGDLGYATP